MEWNEELHYYSPGPGQCSMFKQFHRSNFNFSLFMVRQLVLVKLMIEVVKRTRQS